MQARCLRNETMDHELRRPPQELKRPILSLERRRYDFESALPRLLELSWSSMEA
jgi:hypothetical protein